MSNIIGCKITADRCCGENRIAGNDGVEIGAGGFRRGGVQNGGGNFIAIADREIDMANAIPYEDNDGIREAQRDNTILRPALLELKNEIINTMRQLCIRRDRAIVKCDDEVYFLIDKLEQRLYRMLAGIALLEGQMQEIDAYEMMGG